MTLKRIFIFVLALGVMAALSGCGLGGNNNNNAKPSPTLPFPTNIVVATPGGGGTSVPPQPSSMSISGDVFNDSNGNGAKDGGEPVIAGVVVLLGGGECPGTTQAQTTSTASSPSYKFDGLSAGAYCVSIDAASEQNAAILGQGAWTVPQQAQGTIAQSVNLQNAGQGDVNFGWTFAAIGEVTPVPEQPTAVAEQPTAVPPPLLPTPTAFVQPTAGPQPCVYRAAYIQDVTIPDGTVVATGAQFTKTWRVQNTGTCSWGPGSGLQNLAFVGGDPLGAPNLVPIPNAIPAGATADLSIQMTAPAQGGSYKSNWKLRADDGSLIGVGPSNVALYVLINVRAATAVPPPTLVQPPTPVPPSAQPITFAPGATEAEAQGQLPSNGIASYSVDARQGQSMALSLSSNSNTARIAVLSPTGLPLPPQRGNPEGTYWQGTLPVNGKYIVQVLAGNGAATANYSLDVTIPVRISFAPGAISAQVQGTTSQGRIVTYLLKANGGQTMTVNLNAPPNSAGITIYGLDDGQPLVRSQSGATSFNGPLPATQDYVIQVVPFGNGQVSFTLNTTVQ